jgi:ABC-type multidrug transport system ATPase subunit
MAMEITLKQASKRFYKDWIFKDLTHTILPNSACSITGSNGAGKSTLLQILSGYISITKGSINWTLHNNQIEAENIFKYQSFSSPAMMLLHEFTAIEMINFHASVKQMHIENANEILNSVGLQNAKNDYIKNFSSGMVQRLKLAIAFYTNTPLLLLDEPTANLDAEGKLIYHKLINQYLGKRTIIIASNDEAEYAFCTSNIKV